MLTQHLKMITNKADKLSDEEIVIFGALCMERQLNILRKHSVNISINVVQEEIQKFMDSIWLKITKGEARALGSTKKLEQIPERLSEEGDMSDPEFIIYYSVINTLVDFIIAVGKNETQYIIEYSPYRNLDLVGIFEENLLGEIEEEFDKKEEQIKEIYISEINRQIDEINLLCQHPDIMKIEKLIKNVEKIDVLNGSWL